MTQLDRLMAQALDLIAEAVEANPEAEQQLMVQLYTRQRPQAHRSCTRYEIYLQFRLPEDELDV